MLVDSSAALVDLRVAAVNSVGPNSNFSSIARLVDSSPFSLVFLH